MTRARYRRLAAGSVVPSGWIAVQARQNLDGFVGALPAISAEVGGDVFGAGRIGPDSAAEAANVANVGWWNGESEGNWLHGFAGHVRMIGTESQRREVDRRLKMALDHCDADGYLGMFTSAARAGAGWLPGDLWTRSRLLLTLADHAASRQLQAVWTAVDRCLEQARTRYPMSGAFVPSDPDTLVAGHDLQFIEPLVDAVTRSPASRQTGELAGFAVQMYEDFAIAPLNWVERDAQPDMLGSDEPFHGHGAHVVENLRIPLRLWEIDPDPEHADRLLTQYRSGWRKLGSCLGVTGACRSDETVGHPGEPAWPLPESGFEYCATTELAFTALEHTRILGDPDGSDLAESLWLNAAQAARVDAGGIGYFFAENQTAATSAQGKRWDVSPTHDDAAVCCAPNAGRILPLMVDGSVLGRDHGLSVQQYLPTVTTTRVDGSVVTLAISTDYPFGDDIGIELVGATGDFVLELRIPRWCTDPQVVAFPGARVSEAGQLIMISGRWPEVAQLTVRLPRVIRELRSADGRTAVSYGPLTLSRPIEPIATTSRRYPGGRFADRDVVPADPQQLFPPYLLAPIAGQARVELSDPGPDPWAEPGLVVWVSGLDPNPRHASLGGAVREKIPLVPIGATTLRWTCLPVLN